MPTSKLDTTKLDKEISSLEEPTSAALGEALRAISDERAGLERLEQHIKDRLEALDRVESTVRSVAPDGGGRGSRRTASSTRKRTTKKTTKKAAKKATRKRATRRRSVSVGDTIEKELTAAGTALSMDQLAERVEKAMGERLDRRGLAGALNGGIRSGRFVKTPTGSFNLPTTASTGTATS